MDRSTTTLAQDDLFRCPFYAILPHQTIVLFRGGYVDGPNEVCGLCPPQQRHVSDPNLIHGRTSQ